MASPTSRSVPYEYAVSIWRIPAASAARTAALQVPGGELLSDWNVPKPTAGIEVPEERGKLLDNADEGAIVCT